MNARKKMNDWVAFYFERMLWICAVKCTCQKRVSGTQAWAGEEDKSSELYCALSHTDTRVVLPFSHRGHVTATQRMMYNHYAVQSLINGILKELKTSSDSLLREMLACCGYSKYSRNCGIFFPLINAVVHFVFLKRVLCSFAYLCNN